MVDVINLNDGEFSAVISPVGAWLERFDDVYGPILFPKQSLTLPDGSRKIRGGCHVCLPNFGPGGESGLQQHGFARTASWNTVRRDDKSVSLRLTGGPEGYKGLVSNLHYELIPQGLAMTLTTHNTNTMGMRLAPAFHPYFSYSGDEVVLDGKTIHDATLAEAQILSTTPKVLEGDGRRVMMRADNLNTWVLWTDNLDEYVCIEPTAYGFSFVSPLQKNEILPPDGSRSWSFTIQTEQLS